MFLNNCMFEIKKHKIINEFNYRFVCLYMCYRCAFTNTPKYNEAKRQGAYRIVISNWIDKCHSNRCRYPWRR